MQHLSLLAPDVDHLIHVARHYNTHKDSPLSQKAHVLVLELKKLKVQGDDDFRSLYIEAARGDITDYGSYEEFLEEGMVDNYIVPEYITPRYCHSLFPKEDRIIDFMNLYAEDEKEIISKAHWYPAHKIELG